MQSQSKSDKGSDYLRQLETDYKDVFGTKAGQRVLEDIKRAGFIYQDTFHENPYWSAKHQGMRALALHILSMSKTDTKKPLQKEGER